EQPERSVHADPVAPPHLADRAAGPVRGHLPIVRGEARVRKDAQDTSLPRLVDALLPPLHRLYSPLRRRRVLTDRSVLAASGGPGPTRPRPPQARRRWRRSAR